MSKTNNAWKRGLRMLAPGFYADDAGALHINAAEVLKDKGYPHSPENEAMLRDELARVFEGAEMIDVEDPTA